MKRPTLIDLAAIACAVVVALQGCGGSDPADEAAAPTGPVTIQLFGDSTQFLAGPPYWEQRYPGQVDNQAVPGTSSGQLLTGTDGQHAAWPAPVDADIVVIKDGANDCLSWFNTSVEQYKANLRGLVAGAKASHALPVLETPDPTLDVARPNEPLYTQAVRDVAAETGTTLIDTDACWRARPGGWADLIGSDAEHANEVGRAYTVTNCVAPVIDALVAKISKRSAS